MSTAAPRARPAAEPRPELPPALATLIRTIGPPVTAAALLICLLTYWVVSGGFGTIARVRISVVGATVPAPATPGLTAAYLTIRDTGAEPDELLAVHTTAATQSLLINNPTSGPSGTMNVLQGIQVPAHGSATLGPFGDDVMLIGAGKLTVGETVTLILTFRRIGDVTVTATVTPPGTP